MIVPVQYQRTVTVPANGVPVAVTLEDDLPSQTGIIMPKVSVFNTSDAIITVNGFRYQLDFGVTDNPLQTGLHEYDITAAEWGAPYSGAGDIDIAAGASQPVPLSRVSALLPHNPPTHPVRHLLDLKTPVDEDEEQVVRLVFSGFIDQTHRGAINNFRTL